MKIIVSLQINCSNLEYFINDLNLPVAHLEFINYAKLLQFICRLTILKKLRNASIYSIMAVVVFLIR